jgi:hypothetical protein
VKVIKEKAQKEQIEPTYGLTELSVKELKNIRTGLEMLWAKTDNKRIRLMIADINSGALKDHNDDFNNAAVDTEEIEKRNKAMLKALGRLMPAVQSDPVPDSLRGFTYK